LDRLHYVDFIQTLIVVVYTISFLYSDNIHAILIYCAYVFDIYIFEQNILSSGFGYHNIF